MARTGLTGRTTCRALMGAVAGMVLAVPLLLSGCSSAVTAKRFSPILLTIRADAATGPDFSEQGRIADMGEADYFELRLRRGFTSVIVMTTGTTDTAGVVETADRVAITETCAGEEPVQPCVYSYDADIAHNEERSEAFNGMDPSGNFLWEGHLPGPERDAEYRTYYIRVTGQDAATGDYTLTVELHEGEGPMYT